MGSVLKVDFYRTAALEARTYVNHHLPFGPSNKIPDRLSEIPGAWVCSLGLQMSIKRDVERQGTAARVAGYPYQRGSGRLTRQMIEIWSKWGLKDGCGNCGVQSAMAFVRLRDHSKAFPLDWMQIAGGDHAFVIVGRKSQTEPGAPATWNDEAIVCDPWHDAVEQANAYSGLREKRVELMYRQESARGHPE